MPVIETVVLIITTPVAINTAPTGLISVKKLWKVDLRRQLKR